MLAAIESFRFAQGFEAFFADVERRASLDGAEQEAMLKKVGQARALLGGVNPLERFARWVPPEESGDEAAEDDEDE